MSPGYPQAAWRSTVEALESERVRRVDLADLDRLIGVLAGAMLSRPPHGHQIARDGRAAEYARLRAAGFSREQAAEEIRVYSRTTISRYEHLRARQGAA